MTIDHSLTKLSLNFKGVPVAVWWCFHCGNHFWDDFKHVSNSFQTAPKQLPNSFKHIPNSDKQVPNSFRQLPNSFKQLRTGPKGCQTYTNNSPKPFRQKIQKIVQFPKMSFFLKNYRKSNNFRIGKTNTRKLSGSWLPIPSSGTNGLKKSLGKWGQGPR